MPGRTSRLPWFEIEIVVAELAVLDVEEEPRLVPRSAETVRVVLGLGAPPSMVGRADRYTVAAAELG
jgi:hypothetical protein